MKFIFSELNYSSAILFFYAFNNDPLIMKEWLENKIPENISQWINSTNNISLATLNTLKGKLSGFILMNKDGEILLNYVLPSHIYKGVGKVLLKEYERNGFIKNGEPAYVGAILGDFPL